MKIYVLQEKVLKIHVALRSIRKMQDELFVDLRDYNEKNKAKKIRSRKESLAC